MLGGSGGMPAEFFWKLGAVKLNLGIFWAKFLMHFKAMCMFIKY